MVIMFNLCVVYALVTTLCRGRLVLNFFPFELECNFQITVIIAKPTGWKNVAKFEKNISAAGKNNRRWNSSSLVKWIFLTLPRFASIEMFIYQRDGY
ncbi:Septation ring formation regulator EzrA [Trichinella spiralis]|uniref:Septation ring formation regulator EzrA n=1 Tax=Trichinella spiralis TaxID=6334 RepID=A0ABR3K188_TRISP